MAKAPDRTVIRGPLRLTGPYAPDVALQPERSGRSAAAVAGSAAGITQLPEVHSQLGPSRLLCLTGPFGGVRKDGRVSRRLTGAAVILLILVVVITMSVTRSREMAGQQQAVPVAGPPAVGACLGQSVSGVDTVTSQDNQPIFPSVAVGGCAGLHFGEVVAVIGRRLAVPTDALSALDTYQKWCSPALNNWTGRAPDPFAPGWVLEIPAGRQVSVVFTGPDQRQLASGQQWVACIAVPQVTDSHGGTSSSYVGSIRNGFSRLPAPPGLSSCWEQLQPTYGTSGSVDCAGGHRVEVLGHKFVTGTSGAGSSASDDQDGSCAQFARTVTGMADPTAGGRLTVQSQVSGPADAQPGVMADAWCVMSPSVPTQYLFGPLLSVGNAPVPLR